MKDPQECRETITKGAEGEGKFIRQSGGTGQYGHVVIMIAPNGRGRGIDIRDKVIGGSIPTMFVQSAKDGILEGLNHGVNAGYQVVDVVVQIVDGSFHETDSSELAFKMAGIFAVKDAMKKAGPIVLE